MCLYVAREIRVDCGLVVELVISVGGSGLESFINSIIIGHLVHVIHSSVVDFFID